jgi:hypothetical protein
MHNFQPNIQLPKQQPKATIDPPTPQTPSEWATTQLQFHPDPHQSALLDSQSPRLLLNCTRQWGKSTCAALLALHQSLSESASLTLLLSPSQRQSSELLHKIRVFAAALHLNPKSAPSHPHSLKFPNDSRIIALPNQAHTIRGFSSVSLLILDEAAQIPDSLYFAVRPFLARSNGRLLLMSTPNGQRGFFYQAWASPNPWHRVEVPATQCPRISQTFLEEERRTLSQAFFAQEYLCQFQTAQRQVFNPKVLAEAFTSNFSPLKLS